MASGQNLRGSKVRSERLILRAWISLFFSADPRSAGGSVSAGEDRLFAESSAEAAAGINISAGGSGSAATQKTGRAEAAGESSGRQIRKPESSARVQPSGNIRSGTESRAVSSLRRQAAVPMRDTAILSSVRRKADRSNGSSSAAGICVARSCRMQE